MRLVRALLVVGLAALGVAAPAQAGPLGLEDCGPAEGVYRCDGLVETWDGVPLDVTVVLPRESTRRAPLVTEIHGFGNSKHEYLDPNSTAYTDNAFAWARDGYAVLTYTARGLWGSCGTPEARAANEIACATGYIHLADVRYEARDAQELIGRMVDERYAHPRKLGVTGDSYGGGQSLMLTALADRTMRPDGALVPWRTPSGRRLRLAAAAPVIPWSDLIYAAAPNGRVAATRITPRARANSPVGVEKATFVNAIFAAAQFATGPGQPIGEPFVPGRPMGFLAPPLVDPEADVTNWVSRTSQGEPYTDANARAIVETLARYHSAYNIDSSRRPPPLFLASGFTDDLFPVDEVLRFANRTQRKHPRAPLSLLLGDFGHQRAANKPAERAHLLRAIHRWFDHYLRGRGRTPGRGAKAYVQTCPRERPGLGPYSAKRFGRLAPRALRSRDGEPQTITSDGGDPQIGAALDPVAGGGDSCAQTDSAHAEGTARYVLKRAGRRAVTMIGAPRIRANLAVTGAEPSVAQVAGRLWDVAPDGTQRLVARGSYRPRAGRNVWQLHPGSWRFRRSHAAELELLGNDAPYSRPSNGAFEIEVTRLRSRLPVR